MPNATKPQATPGPWRVVTRMIDGRPTAVIDVMGLDGVMISPNVFVRDANLIAAAPLMREALEMLAKDMDARPLHYSDNARMTARAALRAATGEKE